ncbi:MAG: L,D-transpeptidase family protein [Verrucomicrobiales bacterium]|nr:L,D-transpeptidase family protein [Verrucomicrobiales bacterium]
MYKSLLIIFGIIYLAPTGFSKKAIGHLPEPSKKDTETILRIQIFLDEKMFGPGKIDGQMGQFTRKAVAHYNFGYDLKYDNYYKVINESNAVIDELFTTYTIKEEDFNFVGEVSFEPSEQAEIDYLYYRSILEFAAERFHSDEKYLTKINPEIDWEKATAGTVINVLNVTPFKIEDIKKDKSFQRERKLSKRLVIVDTTQKLVAIWEKKKILATFPITPGQEKFIHRGSWVIQNMITTPTFRWDQSMLETGKRSNEAHLLPPGPNSPIGIFWAGLNKGGIGLHGTSSPHTIGRSRSAGCVRLANWDVVRLSNLVRPGAKVEMR